jgi:hypothetical protein
VDQRAETKHGSVEDKPRDDTGPIQSRQNGETGTVASPKAASTAAKGVKRRELHIYILRRDGLRVPHAVSDLPEVLCNARDN